MELRRYRDGDLGLTEALDTDPRVMHELGGPVERSRLPDIHRRRVSDPWWFTIAPEHEGPPVGQIGIWRGALDGTPIHETGWLLLPAFHGRGLADAALRLLIERARAEPTFASLHAFPAVTNAPSNALCHTFAFVLRGRRELPFRGHTLRCNHWELPLTGPHAPGEVRKEARYG